MAKITITLELDEVAYRAKYGPGSEHWEKYMVDHHYDSDSDRCVHTVKPDSDYKPLEGMALEDAIQEVLHESLHDWSSQGWMKVTIDGKEVCKGCGRVEGRPHQDWCAKIVEPEA